jgi:hypothetical protein
MKFKDHKNVSRYLERSQSRRIKARNRWALIVGSVIPDIAVFTYFRGSLSGRKLKGHNYENTCGIIGDLIETISDSDKYGIKRYFEIGKLLHYSADSFTYAHNLSFTGTLGEHRAYEMELHERLNEAMMSDAEGLNTSPSCDEPDLSQVLLCGEDSVDAALSPCTESDAADDACEMYDRIRQLHCIYSEKSPDSRNDCRYIMYVLGYIYSTLAVEHRHAAA